MKQVPYIGNHIKVTIECPYHGDFEQVPMSHLRGGDFEQTPASHLAGCGCPRCPVQSSKGEIEVLDEIGIPEECRQVRIGGYICDGIDYDTNPPTIYEYDGDIWHGNPAIYEPEDVNPKTGEKYGDLYAKTLMKRQSLEQLGYTVVHIWESEREPFLEAYRAAKQKYT